MFQLMVCTVNPAGNISFIIIPVAVFGPLFLAVTVYVIVLPTLTGEFAV